MTLSVGVRNVSTLEKKSASAIHKSFSRKLSRRPCLTAGDHKKWRRNKMQNMLRLHGAVKTVFCSIAAIFNAKIVLMIQSTAIAN